MTMAERSEFFFLKDKPGLALLAVRDLDPPAYASKVAKEIDSTFSHTVKMLSKMEGMSLIRSRPEGRIRRLELTERGEKAATVISELMEVLRYPSVEWNKLEHLGVAVKEAESRPRSESVLRIGPLRRDLALLKSGDDGDGELRQAAEDMDRKIVDLISRSD